MKRVEAALMFLMLTAIAQPDAWACSEGTPGKRTIVVSIPHRRVALIEGGQVVKTYSVAVGATRTPSPVGEFSIVNRVPHPTYYAPGKVIKPGRSNPLGTRWLGLSQKGYGIHGTNVPHSIGKAASHGCIRLKNSDAEELFELVQVGDIVEIRRESDPWLDALFVDTGAGSQPTPPTGPKPEETAKKTALVLALGASIR